MSDPQIAIGWYVHHQGLGHAMRFLAVADRMREISTEFVIVGLGSKRPDQWDGPWVQLPRDDVPYPQNADEQASGALHWAPVLHEGLRRRSLLTAQWLASSGCPLFVVDVSVEMLLLGRLCSVPTVSMAMRGRREDRPHALGYDVAKAILAPWPSRTQEPLPERWSSKLIAVGAFSRFDSLIDDRVGERIPGRNVLLLLGHGGHEVPFKEVAEAAAATPEWHWNVLGVSAAETGLVETRNLRALGYVRDIWTVLRHMDVVIGPCGTGTVSEVAAARKPFIALPQARPFDEQITQARILEAHGLADVAWSWPHASIWPGLLEESVARGGEGWRWYNDGQGATRLCEALMSLAMDGGAKSRPIEEHRSNN